jgi:hypothetical protein
MEEKRELCVLFLDKGGDLDIEFETHLGENTVLSDSEAWPRRTLAIRVSLDFGKGAEKILLETEMGIIPVDSLPTSGSGSTAFTVGARRPLCCDFDRP